MNEPYDVTRPADFDAGLRRFVDRTGREWTEPAPPVLPPRTRVAINRTCAEVTVSFGSTADAEAFYDWLARNMVVRKDGG